jgi:hypothetical protein
VSKPIGLLGICVAIALGVLTWADPASATTVCVVGTTNTNDCDTASTGPGGTLSLTSTNTSLAISGGGDVTCTHTTLTGTAPSENATDTVATPITFRPTGSTAFFLAATVGTTSACNPGGTAPITLNLTATPVISPYSTLTIPTGCTITANIASIGCTLTIKGPQTIGNDTPSTTGGQTWTNGTASVASTDIINSSTVSTVISNGVGFGCSTAGHHTAVLKGTFAVTTPTTKPGAEVKLVTRWHSTNYTQAFSAAASAVRFVTEPSETPINCTHGTFNGHLDPDQDGPKGPTPWTKALYAMTPVFTGCTVGTTSLTFQCGAHTWDTGEQGTAYNSGTATSQAGAAGRGTSGKFWGFNCIVRKDPGSTGCTSIDGSALGAYINPDGSIDKAIVDVVTSSDQTLAMTPWTCAGLGIPNTDTDITVGAPGADTTDLNILVLTVQSPTDPRDQPILWYGRP